MTRTQKKVRVLFKALRDSPKQLFPDKGGRLNVPHSPGVYVIYDPRGRVVHVGATPRGKRGLAQRLKNHLHGASSFVERHLNGRGSRLRLGYSFRCLAVRDGKLRAYLEAYAIGSLCPAHIGLGASRTQLS
jgi:hypothetical protein